MSFSSSVDVATIYRPPSELQYPGGDVPIFRTDSPQSSSSSDSDLSSPSFNRDSDLVFCNKMKTEQLEKSDKNDTGSFENESDSNSTTTPKTVVSNYNTQQGSTSSSDVDRPGTPKRNVKNVTCFSYKNNAL